jgi:hypothetical protein
MSSGTPAPWPIGRSFCRRRIGPSAASFSAGSVVHLIAGHLRSCLSCRHLPIASLVRSFPTHIIVYRLVPGDIAAARSSLAPVASSANRIARIACIKSVSGTTGVNRVGRMRTSVAPHTCAGSIESLVFPKRSQPRFFMLRHIECIGGTQISPPLATSLDCFVDLLNTPIPIQQR